jgi:hypothetical protein
VYFFATLFALRQWQLKYPCINLSVLGYRNFRLGPELVPGNGLLTTRLQGYTA